MGYIPYNNYIYTLIIHINGHISHKLPSAPTPRRVGCLLHKLPTEQIYDLRSLSLGGKTKLGGSIYYSIIYIYISIYIFIYSFIYLFIHLFIHLFIYTYPHKLIIYIYIYICIVMYIIYIYIYVFMYYVLNMYVYSNPSSQLEI